MLNQRGIIETVIGHLKYHYQIWHTRHRSILNTMTHLVSALAAYAIKPLKISALNCSVSSHENPKLGLAYTMSVEKNLFTCVELGFHGFHDVYFAN